MKTLPFAQILALGLACFAAPISAQNLVDLQIGRITRMKIQRVESTIPERHPLCVVKNSLTLDSRLNTIADMNGIIDVEVLGEPSFYKTGPTDCISGSQDTFGGSLALLAATYRESARQSTGQDESEIILSVRQKIRIDPSSVCGIVGNEVSANPSSACEIVKAAIQTTEADTPLIVAIVDSAIHASPELMRLISQCAIASAPDSLPAIQALLARLDPNTGDSGSRSKSAKSGKSSKTATDDIDSRSQAGAKQEPLDLPRFYPIIPDPIIPQLVTNVNP